MAFELEAIIRELQQRGKVVSFPAMRQSTCRSCATLRLESSRPRGEPADDRDAPLPPSSPAAGERPHRALEVRRGPAVALHIMGGYCLGKPPSGSPGHRGGVSMEMVIRHSRAFGEVFILTDRKSMPFARLEAERRYYRRWFLPNLLIS